MHVSKRQCTAIANSCHHQDTPLSTERARYDGHDRGAPVLVNKRVHHKMNPNSSLQAVATRVWLGKWYTICSLYLPHVDVTKQDLEQSLARLRPPFLFLGDMNAKSAMWCEATTHKKCIIFGQLSLNI